MTETTNKQIIEIDSFDEIPHFESKAKEAEFWTTHCFSERLLAQIQRQREILTQNQIDFPTKEQIQAVRDYIKATWKTLTRSLNHIVEAAKDPKIDHEEDKPWLVYISPQEDLDKVKESIREVLTEEKFAEIEIRTLPAEVELIEEHGLLYLPDDYVVPGGRFNEMYGWDSYFILLGLLHDGELELAKSLMNQHIYEIEHYGTILNANRTYLLTRSQPPFFTPMVTKLFEYTQDKEWLRSILPIAQSYYYYWTVPPHLNQATGLSRYYDLGFGPAPEVIISERDEGGRTHYDRIKEYYRHNEVDDYDLSIYYDRPSDRLTNLFYKGDRSMRESGLDPTNRFGPFSIDVIHYAPVCLNCLLIKMEQDFSYINKILGHKYAEEYWIDRVNHRKELIDHFLWDEELGLYFDYNFTTSKRRHYEYLSTFYPLWVGIASPEQAKRVVQNLDKFEVAGGLRTSTCYTGNQWDAPFGWAPLHQIAIQGMENYGYTEEAERIKKKFINLLVKDFERSGTLLEKYDVENLSGDICEEIDYGYCSNEVGFGWTNGVFLELLANVS